MKYSFILIVLSKTLIPLLGNTIGICSNTSIGEPLICCPNFRKVGENCEECWPGTYDINCIPCPVGFYGRFCTMSCHNSCIPCDPVTGCTDFTESAIHVHVTNNTGYLILASIGGFVGIFGVLVGILIRRNCMKACSPTVHIYDQSTDFSNETIEEQNNYDALQKNEEYEEVFTGQGDCGRESIQQTNSGQNMYIDICD